MLRGEGEEFLALHKRIRREYKESYAVSRRVVLMSRKERKSGDVDVWFLERIREEVRDAQEGRMTLLAPPSYSSLQERMKVARAQLRDHLECVGSDAELLEQPHVSCMVRLTQHSCMQVLRRREALRRSQAALASCTAGAERKLAHRRMHAAISSLMDSVREASSLLSQVRELLGRLRVAPFSPHPSSGECDQDVRLWLQLRGLQRYSGCLSHVPWSQLKSLTLQHLRSAGVGRDKQSRLRTLALLQAIDYSDWSHVLKSGWLHKRGDVNRRLRRRFAVLLENCELLYFKSSESPKPQGSIALLRVTEITCPSDTQMCLTTPSREYFLSFSSPSLQQQWLSVLKISLL